VKIEAVTVCVNYSDFLAHTIPENINHVDRLVVVTTHADKATQELCRKYSVDCVMTEDFFKDGDKFNKGRAINYALSHLRWDDKVIHLDADIVLPMRFRQMLHYHDLKDDTVYGMDRLNVKNYENWTAHKNKTKPQHQYRFMVTPQEQFPIGSRLLHSELGWLPCGYFQLWSAKTGRRYPVNAGSSEHSDVVFAAQWSKRVLMPEMFCYHLESEEAPMGINWQGRKTKIFGPCHTPPPPPPHGYCKK